MTRVDRITWFVVYLCIGFIALNNPVDQAHAPTGKLVAGEAAPYSKLYANFAKRWWEKRGGFVNCPDGVEVIWAPLDWISRSIQEGRVAVAWGDLGGCVIRLNKYAYRSQSPEQRCGTLLHEWGHLIGLQHDPNPKHVMYYKGARHPSCKRFNRNKSLWIILDLYEDEEIVIK